MTLIQTAKLNGVNPMAYLTDVWNAWSLDAPKAHEFPTLLPWNCAAATSGKHW